MITTLNYQLQNTLLSKGSCLKILLESLLGKERRGRWPWVRWSRSHFGPFTGGALARSWDRAATPVGTRTAVLPGHRALKLFQGGYYLIHGQSDPRLVRYALEGEVGCHLGLVDRVLAIETGIHDMEDSPLACQVGFCPLHEVVLPSGPVLVYRSSSWKHFQEDHTEAINITLWSEMTFQGWRIAVNSHTLVWRNRIEKSWNPCT